MLILLICVQARHRPGMSSTPVDSLDYGSYPTTPSDHGYAHLRPKASFPNTLLSPRDMPTTKAPSPLPGYSEPQRLTHRLDSDGSQTNNIAAVSSTRRPSVQLTEEYAQPQPTPRKMSGNNQQQPLVMLQHASLRKSTVDDIGGATVRVLSTKPPKPQYGSSFRPAALSPEQAADADQSGRQ